jgi:hypothetical protein
MPMKRLDPVELFARAAGALRSEFEILSRIPHFGASGQAVEDTLRAILTKHLPARFATRAGFAVGVDGEVSHQSDILIADAYNTPCFLSAHGTGVYPVDGILGLIEVTTSLTAEKWHKDCQKISRLRNLLLAHHHAATSTEPLGVIFATDTSVSLETVAKWMADSLRAADDAEGGRRHAPCGALVLGQGLVCCWDADRVSFDPATASGVAYTESTNTELAVFLHLLTHQLRSIAENRLKAVAYTALELGEQFGPQFRMGIGQARDDVINAVLVGIEAAVRAQAHFPDLVSYMGPERLQQQLAPSVKVVALE